MACNCKAWLSGPAKTSGNVILALPLLIKPVFQRFDVTAMAQHFAIPQSLQRRHFVKAGSSAGFKRKLRIGGNAHLGYPVSGSIVWRNFKTLNRHELVIGIERWRMALLASLAGKNLLSSGRKLSASIRVHRWFQRIDVQSH